MQPVTQGDITLLRDHPMLLPENGAWRSAYKDIEKALGELFEEHKPVTGKLRVVCLGQSPYWVLRLLQIRMQERGETKFEFLEAIAFSKKWLTPKNQLMSGTAPPTPSQKQGYFDYLEKTYKMTGNFGNYPWVLVDIAQVGGNGMASFLALLKEYDAARMQNVSKFVIPLLFSESGDQVFSDHFPKVKVCKSRVLADIGNHSADDNFNVRRYDSFPPSEWEKKAPTEKETTIHCPLFEILLQRQHDSDRIRELEKKQSDNSVRIANLEREQDVNRARLAKLEGAMASLLNARRPK